MKPHKNRKLPTKKIVFSNPSVGLSFEFDQIRFVQVAKSRFRLLGDCWDFYLMSSPLIGSKYPPKTKQFNTKNSILPCNGLK